MDINIFHRLLAASSFSNPPAISLFLSLTSTSLSSVQIILLPCPSPTSSLFPSRLASLLHHPSVCQSLAYRCPHLFLSPGPYLCLSVHRCPLWPATAVPPCAATKCWCAVRKGKEGGLMNIHVNLDPFYQQSLALPRKPLPSMRWWKRGTVRLGQTLCLIPQNKELVWKTADRKAREKGRRSQKVS